VPKTKAQTISPWKTEHDCLVDAHMSVRLIALFADRLVSSFRRRTEIVAAVIVRFSGAHPDFVLSRKNSLTRDARLVALPCRLMTAPNDVIAGGERRIGQLPQEGRFHGARISAY
jgi:hypothetical protein